MTEVFISIPTPNEFNCSPYEDPLGDERPCTLSDIDGDIDATDDYKPKLKVEIVTKDYPLTFNNTNAEMKQKGKLTRRSKQKSYRITLDKGEEFDESTFQYGERTWQLNKHPNDYSRIRNKLSFDLFQTIPNITSLKTRFVNLKINNNEYGLFTSYVDGILKLGWEESIDFENDEIVYDVYFADNIEFENPIVEEISIDKSNENLTYTDYHSFIYTKNINLEKGKTFYLKVIAKEKYNHEHYQIGFEKTVRIDDIKYFGVLDFLNN